MQFLALDFETATPAMDSPCELGIAVVRDGVVSEVRNWLIKPPQWPHFSPFNMAVHGIRPEEVADAPTWPRSGARSQASWTGLPWWHITQAST